MDCISVIVPVHNGAGALDRCVESIVNQTYRHLEIVLVNNASTDNSLALCAKWQEKDSRIKVVDLPDAGVSKARNAGLAVMKGEFFAFVDADDSINSTMYEKLHRELTDKNADIAYCKINSVIDGKRVPREERNLKKFIYEKSFESWFLSGDGYVDRGVWRSLYRSSKLGGVRFDERLSFHEDFAFSMQCVKITDNLAMVDEHLYNYTASRNFDKKYTNACYVENNKIGLEYSVEFLNFKGLGQWARAIYFLWLVHTVVNLLRYREDGVSECKGLLADGFWTKASAKENCKAYARLFNDKSGWIKRLLIKFKMFGTYRRLLNLKSKI